MELALNPVSPYLRHLRFHLMILWAIAPFAAARIAYASDDRAPVLSSDSSVDQILDALDARGDNLDSLAADVAKSEVDVSLGEDTETRTGRVIYQRKADGNVRIRASFDKVKTGEKTRSDRIEYVLENGVLIDRTYRSKVENRQTVQRPGEKIDLFRLGQGPFPLPIGQDKADVHAEFEVEKVAPAAGDPKDTVHVKLIPRPTTELSRKFKSIDVWVDQTDHMPRLIKTLNAQETVQTRTELSNVKVNAKVEDRDFELEKVKDSEWQINQE